MNRWLILDDDIFDRKLLEAAIKENGDEVCPTASVEDARQLLKNKPFDICLFDFYFDKERKITAAKFIAELREWMPSRPIIIISNASDAKHVRPCLMAGADVFMPKQRDHLSLASALKVAGVSAKIRREMHLQATAIPQISNELYLSKKTQVIVDHVLSLVTENVAICGLARTGKTTLAKNLATEFQKRYPARFKADNVFYLDCASVDAQRAEEILFGKQTDEGALQLDVFERSEGGIVVLDNIDYLARPIQKELREILERGFYKTKGRPEINLGSIKFIVTYSREDEAKLSKSFLAKVASQTVTLPSISDLSGELDALVKFLIRRETQANRFPKLSLGDGYIDALLSYLKTERLAGNFSSLLNILNECVLVAKCENRQILFPSDIPSYAPPLAQKDENPSKLSPENEELERHIAALIRILREGREFREAKNLVREIMLISASAQFGESRTRLAEALGISRAAIKKIPKRMEA